LFTFSFVQAQSDLVITEIMYNRPESGVDSTEYIEFYNSVSSTIDLTGYSFKMGFTYVFRASTIASGEYFVITVDSAAHRNVYGTGANAQWTTGSLSNGGESIVLGDAKGVTLDSLRYDDVSPWPIGPPSPDGTGSSIVLCDYT
jgi:ribonucleotide reductase alpha subunit